jgi:hypothetical protein
MWYPCSPVDKASYMPSMKVDLPEVGAPSTVRVRAGIVMLTISVSFTPGPGSSDAKVPAMED